MLADLRAKEKLGSALGPVFFYLQRPIRLFRAYNRNNLRADLTAGLSLSPIILPQVIAFTLIAELPPVMGVYAAVVGAAVAALWGSSHHTYTGPTNAISALVLSVLLTSFTPGSPEFIAAAGLLAIMAGLFQLLMGLARLGMMVNFVSHSVIIGFASGAGVLIAIGQVRSLLGLNFSGANVLETLQGTITNLPSTHWPTAALGIGAMALILLLHKVKPKIPAAPVAILVASAVVFWGGLQARGVTVIDKLPQSLPPLADLPLFDLDFIARLSTGALAVGTISLVQTIAISRSIATQTNQRLDSNQEFVGQGLANIAAGLFSGYPTAGSFSLSVVNYRAGARTPLAAVFSSAFVLLIMFTLAPLMAYLPRAVMAGSLIITAYGMIDSAEILRIWRGARGDAFIMLVTFGGTLLLPIEFAVLAGILLSFGLYIMRTSAPRVYQVLPDNNFRHFAHQPGKLLCPQLSVIEVAGDLYFGAVNHVEEAIFAHAEKHPEQRFLLIRMHHVNHCDFSGIHMLENVARFFRDQGGDVFIVRASQPVLDVMRSTGCDRFLGADHFLAEDEAIAYIFHRILDPAVCIYECSVRAFKECQNLPKRIDLINIPLYSEVSKANILDISPQKLWLQLHNGYGSKPPFIVDVREPREFRGGHIPEAQLIPLPTIMSDSVKLPNDRQIILVCRSGRRSRRAAYALQHVGCMNVAVLQGGMQAWEAAGLLAAVE